MRKNKTIIVFLVKFFTTYFILFGAYSLYLNKTQQKTDIFVCSPITGVVADHVDKMSEMLGYDSHIEQNTHELSIKYILDGNYVARIVEGCSSISIIILFLSFIIAFSGNIKSTILYGLFGSILIYVVNILRIIAMSVLLLKFPQYEKILHDLFFPAVIYGLTFILWITWVKYFSNLTLKTNG